MPRSRESGAAPEPIFIAVCDCQLPTRSCSVVAASRVRGAEFLSDALRDLAKLNRQHSEIVELRFFGGMNMESVARVLGVSPGTVERERRSAGVWLRRGISAYDHAGR